jgi:hypothetical protein
MLFQVTSVVELFSYLLNSVTSILFILNVSSFEYKWVYCFFFSCSLFYATFRSLSINLSFRYLPLCLSTLLFNKREKRRCFLYSFFRRTLSPNKTDNTVPLYSVCRAYQVPTQRIFIHLSFRCHHASLSLFKSITIHSIVKGRFFIRILSKKVWSPFRSTVRRPMILEESHSNDELQNMNSCFLFTRFNRLWFVVQFVGTFFLYSVWPVELSLEISHKLQTDLDFHSFALLKIAFVYSMKFRFFTLLCKCGYFHSERDLISLWPPKLRIWKWRKN